MPKVKISEYSATANSNTDVASINIDEGCAPSGINNAIRAIMGHLKDFQSGTSNDPFTVGSSGSLTLSYGTANGVAYLNGSKVLTTGSALTFDGTKFTVGIGSTFSDAIADFYQDTNAARYVYARNPNAGAAAAVVFNASAGGGGDLRMTAYGSGHSTLANHASLFNHKLNGQLLFGVEGSERMRLTSTGLGIGTSSPQGSLDVAATGATVNQFLTGGAGNNLVTGIFRIGSGLGRGASIQGFRGASSNTHSLDFYTYNSADVFGMRLDSSGNLGVGTTSPTEKLVIGAGIASEYINVNINGGTSANYGPTLNFLKGGTGFGQIANYGRVQGGTSSDFFITSVGANALLFGIGQAEKARIDTSGNLFINATSSFNGSGCVLQATGSSANQVAAIKNTNANPFGYAILYSAASPNGAGNEFIYCADSTQQKASIRSNGGLANYSANNVNLASDFRLKHNIDPVKSYWEVFKLIEWKTWLYNDQTDELKNIGVIAQELQALAPEFVCESNLKETPEGESPYLGLWENDLKMAGMSVITELVKRCEEQQALITTLTARITALESA